MPVPGQWHLFAYPPSRAVLLWGLAFKTLAVPWGDIPDFSSHETWRQRWSRRTAEAGHPGLPCPCSVGKTQRGAWWVAISPSVTFVNGNYPTPVHPRAVEEDWRAQMDDFWRIMGLPVQAGRWHLVADRGTDE
jgi:hypothetical protein